MVAQFRIINLKLIFLLLLHRASTVCHGTEERAQPGPGEDRGKNII